MHPTIPSWVHYPKKVMIWSFKFNANFLSKSFLNYFSAWNLHNKDDNYWRLSDEQKDIGFIWDYGCEFTLHSVAMKQLKIDLW